MTPPHRAAARAPPEAEDGRDGPDPEQRALGGDEVSVRGYCSGERHRERNMCTIPLSLSSTA